MPDGERIRKVDKNAIQVFKMVSTYLGILEYNKIKKSKIKKNIRREYLRRTELIMKSKLNGRNNIIAIKAQAVYLIRFGAVLVKWTKSEFDEIEKRTRKVMTLNKKLHHRNDVDRLHVSRMGGGREMIGCKMCVEAEENSLGWYVKHHIELLEQVTQYLVKISRN